MATFSGNNIEFARPGYGRRNPYLDAEDVNVYVGSCAYEVEEEVACGEPATYYRGVFGHFCEDHVHVFDREVERS